MFGALVSKAMMMGIKRGLFSNEAGMGSAPNAAAAAHVKHPVSQGLVQMLGVFVDTMIVCTCTAVIILLSDNYGSETPKSISFNAKCIALSCRGVWCALFWLSFYCFSLIPLLLVTMLMQKVTFAFIKINRGLYGHSVYRYYSSFISVR